VEWDPELLIEVDRFNSGYMDTTAACFSLVMGKNYTQRPSEVSQGKYGAVQYLVDTLLVLKCATVADVIIAPWNIVEDWIRIIVGAEWTGNTIYQKLEQVVSLPVQMVKSVILIPIRILFRLIGISYRSIYGQLEGLTLDPAF